MGLWTGDTWSVLVSMVVSITREAVWCVCLSGSGPRQRRVPHRCRWGTWRSPRFPPARRNAAAFGQRRPAAACPPPAGGAPSAAHQQQQKQHQHGTTRWSTNLAMWWKRGANWRFSERHDGLGRISKNSYSQSQSRVWTVFRSWSLSNSREDSPCPGLQSWWSQSTLLLLNREITTS